MSEHDNTDDVGGLVELDAEIETLLADPSMWETPSADLGDRIVASVRAEAEIGAPQAVTATMGSPRRGWLRPALLGAAAAVVFVFGGIVVLSALSGSDNRETFSSELTSTGLVPDVGGDVRIVAFDSGLRIDLDAPSLPRRADGLFYQGWVRTIDGTSIPVGSFHGGERVVLWAGVDLDRVEGFAITLEESVPGDDIGQASSGDVVLRVAVGG